MKWFYKLNRKTRNIIVIGLWVLFVVLVAVVGNDAKDTTESGEVSPLALLVSIVDCAAIFFTVFAIIATVREKKTQKQAEQEKAAAELKARQEAEQAERLAQQARLIQEQKDKQRAHINVENKEKGQIAVIDFETATGKYNSACAIGITIIKNGEIVNDQFFYIQPPDNKYSAANVSVHGITPNITAAEPTFPEVWGKVLEYIDGAYIAAHNASFDMGVLKTTLEYYKMPQPHFMYFDTLHLLDEYLERGEKRTLDALCGKFGIALDHHNAASDAHATAELILYKYSHGKRKDFNAFLNELYLNDFDTVKSKAESNFSSGKFNTSARAKEINETTVANDEKDADFDGKNVLFTGDLLSMSREEAMREVVKRGGTVKDGMSKSVDILVNANPDGVETIKLKRALELRSEGHRIKIIDEKIFLRMLADNNAVDLDEAQ
jgi:DNA polymerase-3 subunit epsilon